MFEYRKLRKNFSEAVGFAYEYLPDSNKRAVQIYIVVKKDNKYNFVKYRRYRYRTYEMLDLIIDEFRAKPIEYYLPTEVLGSVQKVKKL